MGGGPKGGPKGGAKGGHPKRGSPGPREVGAQTEKKWGGPKAGDENITTIQKTIEVAAGYVEECNSVEVPSCHRSPQWINGCVDNRSGFGEEDDSNTGELVEKELVLVFSVL